LGDGTLLPDAAGDAAAPGVRMAREVTPAVAIAAARSRDGERTR
jgi:hypothetical protein